MLGFALMLGCYGDPKLDPVTPDAAPDQTPEPTPTAPPRGGAPSTGDGPTAQGARVEQIGEILTKLGHSDEGAPPESRDGAATWRPAELEKLAELTAGCCRAGPSSCTAGLEPIAAANLPADEIWNLYGSFLGELRPRATEGVGVLGRALLLRNNGAVRDRAFRVAVGAGATRRGQPDDEKRRATTIPLAPKVGESVLFVVEQVSPCHTVLTDLKGPDSRGRIDLEFRTDCPPEPEPEEGIARAARAVWAFDAGPLPVSGFELWMKDGERPLASAAAPPVPPK